MGAISVYLTQRTLRFRAGGKAHPKSAVRVGIRGPGGGRKPLTETDPGLQQALEALVDPTTRGAGQEWQPKGAPEEVRVHDFLDKELGKAIPYGVYDLASNEGWVSVGIDHDTACFATASIRRWWQEMGANRFPRASQLMITADRGGSNSSRNRLRKVALQQLANDLHLRLEVCHFPPGTSKWNKIEHGLLCFISKNWRGRPLTSHRVIGALNGDLPPDLDQLIRG